MGELEALGWKKLTFHKYGHYCGAVVAKHGKVWIAKTVNGVSISGFKTEFQAAAHLVEADPGFWTYGQDRGGWGYYRVMFTSGSLDANREDSVFVCYVSDLRYFPKFLTGTFKKHFFDKATCAKCLLPMLELKFGERNIVSGNKSERNVYLECVCGYPVWRLGYDQQIQAHMSMMSAIRSYERRERVKTNGGVHSDEEIEGILAIQTNRCIYCHVLFTEMIRPTKDHILPVSMGGANWSLNIVLACRSCNSRRGDIPFRTYCKLLSRAQNRRILMQLRKRLIALDINAIEEEALKSFFIGLEDHDSRHWRYRDIQKISPIARRNAAANKLLPRTPILIMKSARLKTGTQRGLN